jgi:hypothetical protein
MDDIPRLSPRCQGDGVRSSSTASAGSSVTVNVGPNDSSLNVVNNSTGDSSSQNVTPGKDTSVTIPNVPPGTIILIEIGTGLNKRVFMIEVIAPGP